MVKPFIKTSGNAKAKERQLREAFIRKLCEWHAKSPDTLILPEFAVGHGAGFADIALVNEALHGFELKTVADNLGRLPIQIAYHRRVFQYSTLVCDHKHVAKARELLPRHWGLVCADENEGVISFTEIHFALTNTERVVEYETHLLWRAECLAILDRFDSGHKLKWRTRDVLYARLLETLPVTLLQKEIVKTIRAREQWREYTLRAWMERHATDL